MARIRILDSRTSFTSQLIHELEKQGHRAELFEGDTKELILAAGDAQSTVVIASNLAPSGGFSLCNRFKRAKSKSRIVMLCNEDRDGAIDLHKKLATRADGYVVRSAQPQAVAVAITKIVNLAEKEELRAVAVQEDRVVVQRTGTDARPRAAAQPAEVAVEKPRAKALTRSVENTEPESTPSRRVRTRRGLQPVSDAPLSTEPTRESGEQAFAMRQTLHDRERDILELREEVSRAKRELLDARGQALSFEKELVQLRERMVELQAIEDTVTPLAARLEETIHALENSRLQVADLTQVADAARRELSVSEAELHTVREACENLVAVRARDAEAHQAELEKESRMRERVLRDLSDTRAALTDSETRLREHESEIAGLRRDDCAFKEQSRELASALERLNQSEARIRAQELAAEAFEQEKSLLEDQLEEAQADNHTLTARVQQLGEQILEQRSHYTTATERLKGDFEKQVERHADERQRAEAAQARELNAMRREVEDRVSELESRYAQELKDLEVDRHRRACASEERGQMMVNVERARWALCLANQAESASLLAAQATAEAEARITETMAETHRRELERTVVEVSRAQLAGFESERAALCEQLEAHAARHQDELRRLSDDHARAAAIASRTYTEKLDQVAEAHARELSATEAKLRLELAEQTSLRSDAMCALSEANERLIAERAARDEERRELERALADQISAMRDKVAEVEQGREHLRIQLSGRLQEALTAVGRAKREAHEAAAAQAKAEFERERAAIEQRALREREGAERDHAEKMKSATARWSNERAALQGELERVEKERAEVGQRLKNQQERLDLVRSKCSIEKESFQKACDALGTAIARMKQIEQADA